MKRFRYEQSDRESGINISPLIDMMFLLLIFFIVTTAFVEEVGIDIDKPQAAAAAALEKKSLMIAVSADGRVVYGGQEIGIHGVRGLVARMLKEDDRPVIVIADGAARSGILVEVIDECKLAGAARVSLATEKK